MGSILSGRLQVHILTGMGHDEDRGKGRRLAAVDVGSNTVHALVADAADGKLDDVAHFVEMPELGPAVQETGAIGPLKTRQAIEALRSVLARAAEHRFEHLVAGATAAVRNASDRDEFLEAAAKAIGVPVRLISEQREAQLSFNGVASRHATKRSWLMADMGGGSTELVVAEGLEMIRWVSLELGSGSFAARFLSDPPRAGEREALRAAALPLVHRAPEFDAQKMVMTGGTASNLPLVISADNPPVVLDTKALLKAAERLDERPAAEVAERTGLPEPRVRALRGGVEILLLLLDFYGLDRIHVSHEGLRHGMLLAYLKKGEDWWK
jgi:exopolyphosphatase / guanosine-5'-triphosphate,3'-diphosphate pyrophosphatase